MRHGEEMKEKPSGGGSGRGTKSGGGGSGGTKSGGSGGGGKDAGKGNKDEKGPDGRFGGRRRAEKSVG